MKTIIITEQQFNKLFEVINEMAYPTSFNMDEFKSLNSFNKRFEYCKQRLQYISSGSGRYVFGIDNDKVLKLAKNNKGVAQNEAEYDMSHNPIVAKTYDSDDDFLWIEMERVDKINVQTFKNLTGLDFRNFQDNIRYFALEVVNKSKYTSLDEPENYDEIWENEFFQDIADLIGSYGMQFGDLTRINSYGVTKNGDIKLVDAGLSQDVYTNHYSN